MYKENKTLKKLPTKVPIHISELLEKKIRYLCNKFPNREWSGFLYYTYTGEVDTPDFSLTAVDLYLMDIGDYSSTDFNLEDNSESLLYQVENGLLNCGVGLIHSHHSMKAFLSTTDSDTLYKEGLDRNHFVSLIVNNEGSYVCFFTKKKEVKYRIEQHSEYRTFGDRVVQQEDPDILEETNIEVHYNECVIHNPNLPKTYEDIDRAILSLYPPKVYFSPANKFRATNEPKTGLNGNYFTRAYAVLKAMASKLDKSDRNYELILREYFIPKPIKDTRYYSLKNTALDTISTTYIGSNQILRFLEDLKNFTYLNKEIKKGIEDLLYGN